MTKILPGHCVWYALRVVLTVVLLTLPEARVTAEDTTAAEILERLDDNMTIESVKTESQMTIRYREGDVRQLKFNSWAIGRDQSFLEFTEPARDAGSRFLRRESSMWIFLPRVGKSVRIQGHMLRQGLMGSDFSYGDASENPSMVDDYEAVIESRDTLDGRPAWVLYLSAKRKDLAYTYRRVWVDAERWVPLKEERFAKSGKLLKTSLMSDVRKIGDRWYPFRIELDNALQSDTRTTLQFLELEFNVALDDDIFTLRHLESGY